MADEPEKVALSSPDLAAEKLAALKELLPGAYADGVLDAGRIGELTGADVAGLKDGSERYGLMWAGKQEAVQSLLKPSQGTLIPDIENSVDFDVAQNVFIEGDNLEVLKLLQKAYNDRIKLIYIDPPYNTGNDFVYDDNFTDGMRGYLEFTGQVDEEGGRVSANVETAGRRHSRWLSMMYPRLVLARNLLAQDGLIFISIDDNEVAALRMVCDEIFGPEDFVTTIMWKRKKEISSDSKNVATQGEYILVYARSGDAALQSEPLDQTYLDASYRQPNEEFPDGLWRPVPITVSKGLKGGGYRYAIETPIGTTHERLWAYPEASYEALKASGKVYFGESGGGVPQRVIYAHESAGKPTTNYWDSTASNKAGKKLVLEMFGDNVFDTPKPVELIQRIIRLIPGKDFVALDFFAGSGSTAHAVALQNAEDDGRRRCISVNLPEPVPEGSVALEAGYETVADITWARIKGAMDLVAGAGAMGLRTFSLGESNFMSPELNGNAQLGLQAATIRYGDDVTDESLACEILVKEGVPLDSSWERSVVGGSDAVSANDVSVVLSREITDEVVEQAIELEPRVLVFLEDGFTNRDAEKANAYYFCQQAGITMKTV